MVAERFKGFSTELHFDPEVLFFLNLESGEWRFQVDPRLKHLPAARRDEIKTFF